MTFDLNDIKGVDGKIFASQEMTRSWIAKALFTGSGVVIAACLIIPVLKSTIEYKDLLGTFVTPAVTLLGTVMGFYFGKNGR